MLALKLGLLFVLVYLIIRLLTTIISFVITRNKSIYREIDVKYNFIVVLSIFALSSFLFSILNFEDNNTKLGNALLASFISLIPLFTNYFLGPLRYLLKSKDYIRSHDYEDEIKKFFNEPLNVILMEKDEKNAFATGIIPFTKTIILNSGLHSILSKEEMRSLLLHEIGHHKNNHLLKLFMVNMTWGLGTMTLFNYLISPYFNGVSYFPIIIGIYFGLVVTGGSLIVSGFFQKKFEYEADAFATIQKEGDNLIHALIKLHDSSKIPHNLWTLHYPSLTQRIERIKNYS